MKTKHKNTKSDSLWNWNDSKSKKRNSEKKALFPFSEFFHKAEESILGPGAGAGVGCGVGVGFGLVGGFGFGGPNWNQFKLVLGVGFGCGVGLGIGYGQGFGYGYSLQSLESYLSEPTSDSKKRGTSLDDSPDIDVESLAFDEKTTTKPVQYANQLVVDNPIKNSSLWEEKAELEPGPKPESIKITIPSQQQLLEAALNKRARKKELDAQKASKSESPTTSMVPLALPAPPTDKASGVNLSRSSSSYTNVHIPSDMSVLEDDEAATRISEALVTDRDNIAFDLLQYANLAKQLQIDTIRAAQKSAKLSDVFIKLESNFNAQQIEVRRLKDEQLKQVEDIAKLRSDMENLRSRNVDLSEVKEKLHDTEQQLSEQLKQTRNNLELVLQVKDKLENNQMEMLVDVNFRGQLEILKKVRDDPHFNIHSKIMELEEIVLNSNFTEQVQTDRTVEPPE